MTRHSWGDPVRSEYRTERTCRRCGMVKVTRKDEMPYWIEWHRDGRRIESERTPPCDERLEWATGEFA
jgi:hypothetical protein